MAKRTWTAGYATYGSANQILTLGGEGIFPGAITANLAETRTYNNMLQLTHLTGSAQGYQYPSTYTGGSVDMQYIYNTGHNNGRVSQTIDNVLGETVNYSYDYLHRLTGATATNGTWGEAFSYDGFGNLTGKTPTVGSAPAWTGSADSNATAGALPPGFDVENRLAASTSGADHYSYVYDPWGRRVWKQDYNTNSGSTTAEAYFYGATGQKLESYSCGYGPTGTLSGGSEGINTYFGGKMLSEKGVFVATDRLGSVRADSNGVTMSYYPWGEERGQGTANGRTKFAGYYRDAIGQDYANARYYSQFSGSFWSPDPKSAGAADTAYGSGTAAFYQPGLGAAKPDNPITWNRYLYSLSDPINFFDPIGKDSCSADGDDCDDDDCGDALSPCAADDGGGGDGGGDDVAAAIGDDDDDSDDCGATGAGIAASMTSGVCFGDTSEASNSVSTALIPTPIVIATPTPWLTTMGTFITNVPTLFVTGFFSLFQGSTSGCDTLTCLGMMQPPPTITNGKGGEGPKPHRKKRKSTWEKHSKPRPGTRQPPNYVPFRKQKKKQDN